MQQERSTAIVARWIFLGVIMLIVQVLLGGITRLTGSGLSITEWKPLMGTIPPLNEEQWQHAFNNYRKIAQYKYINGHFTLSNFKFIFFWEWLHRLWARLIGLVFLFPFIYFLIKKYFKDWMVTPLIMLFLLGAVQGAIGWIMVKSGLNDNDVYVSHIRLAIHFMAAMLLICYALLFGLKITVQHSSRIANRQLYTGAVVLAILVSVQLVYGAFMAGLKGAAAAPTWPSINGAILPFAREGSLSHLIVHDKIIIHFIHRTLAYIIGVCVFAWWCHARQLKFSNVFNKARNFTLALVIIQIFLGILAVLNSPQIVPGHFGIFEWMAQLHQLTGMLLLLSIIACIYLTSYHTRKAINQ